MIPSELLERVRYLVDPQVAACTPEYVVYAPHGWDARCAVLGIDIGRAHLGLVGLGWPQGAFELPHVNFLALISLPPAKTHESTDKMIRLLFDETLTAFAWVRSARFVRIEQQEQQATFNLMIAIGLRSAFVLWRLSHSIGVEGVGGVEYVHGSQKYKVAPLFSQEASDDLLRKMMLEGSLSGQKNKRWRKILAVNDVLALLQLSRDPQIRGFLRDVFGARTRSPEDPKDRKSPSPLEQVHDVCDSYLVAMDFFLRNDLLLPSLSSEDKNSKKRKAVGAVVGTVDLDAVNRVARKLAEFRSPDLLVIQ